MLLTRNTRAQLRQVFEALRELTVPPEPAKRPIGFVPPEEKKNKPAGKAVGKATTHRSPLRPHGVRSRPATELSQSAHLGSRRHLNWNPTPITPYYQDLLSPSSYEGIPSITRRVALDRIEG